MCREKLTLQVLVLTLHGLQVVQRLLVGILHLKHLSAERTSLFLSSFQFCLTLFMLLLPFCQDLHSICNEMCNLPNFKKARIIFV